MRTRGEGVKKSENVADVIYGSPLWYTTVAVIEDDGCVGYVVIFYQLSQHVGHCVSGGTNLDQVLLLIRFEIEPLP